MLFNELKKNITVVESGGCGDPKITAITYDSRKVKIGSLFVAVKGLVVDGNLFIQQAIEKGAVAIVSEIPLPELMIPWISVENARVSLANLAFTLNGVSFDNCFMLGITGTNGKTTTASALYYLFINRYGAKRSWMFGTIEYRLGEKKAEAFRTTPEAADIAQFIGESEIKPAALVMEVSSHSLSLKRLDGIKYDCAIFTNLTQDHLDFHHSMEDYYNAKKLLFTEYCKQGGAAIINCDDPYGKRLCSELSLLNSLNIVSYGRSKSAQYCIVDERCSWSGIEFTIKFNKECFQFKSHLVGGFNIYNMTSMVASAFTFGFSQKEIQKVFEEMETVSGRMETVYVSDKFAVVVDYAHTPDALKNVLTIARDLTKGRLITVFGCGGDRDRLKRPLMAEAVVQNSDEAIITTDNSRTESQKKIFEDIREGIPLDFPHLIISDRKEAINTALKSAQDDDCIVIAGKGHETYQEINGVRSHFDDRAIVLECARELGIV